MISSALPGTARMKRMPRTSLGRDNSRTSDHALRLGLAWWIVGMILAAVYFIFVYRRFSGTVRSGETRYD